jgi:probable F420-dependent oxidoreductase
MMVREPTEVPVPKIELGNVGIAIGPGAGDAFLASVAELERLGYPTVWLTGGQTESLDQVAAAVRATGRIRVATGVLAVILYDADAVRALYADLEASDPGRLVVGLGGAHGPRPFATLGAYLDRLDEPGGVPVDRRVLAALGRQMLGLARDRSSGAFPVLVTPDYTRDARTTLGADTTLAIEQMAVIETDPDLARTLARGRLGFLGSLPQYQASFRRMGFSEEDVTGLGDRLVDALVAWGDADTVAARLRAHTDAGADHVAVSVLSDSDAPPIAEWAALAERLL